MMTPRTFSTWKYAIAWVSVLGDVGVLSAASQFPLHNRDQGSQRGAVASENTLCSQIGINLFNAGGNAADAVLSLWTLYPDMNSLTCLQIVGTTFCVGVIGNELLPRVRSKELRCN